MFKEVGCQGEMLREQNVKGVRLPNLICTLPGKKDKTIIVGAHFDHAQIGDGVIDNWSGASMLPSLYESLKDLSREHTFVFIAFTGEEKGLLGSAHYVRQLTPEQVQNTAAMINLDTLGLTSTKVWQSHADEALVLTIERVAGLLGLPLDIVNVEKVGTADSESFASRNIPHITLHSVTQQTLPIVHSAKDNIRAVNLDYYYDSYRLILAYLTDLDSSLLPRPSEPPAAGESKAKAPIPPFLPSSRF
jgi:Zn-dependent M28 family amino/carboxypeptidase